MRLALTYGLVLALTVASTLATNLRQAGLFMDRRVYVNAPPDEVAALIADARTHARWLHVPGLNLADVEIKKAPDGNGAAYLARTPAGENLRGVAETVADLNEDPRRRLIMLTFPDRKFVYSFHVKAVGEHTLVQLVLTEDLAVTRTARRMFPHLVQPGLEDAAEASQNALRALIAERRETRP